MPRRISKRDGKETVGAKVCGRETREAWVEEVCQYVRYV
jgi:hypothetical protein